MCLAPRDFSPLSVAETPSTLKEFAAERIEAQKEQYVKRRRPQKVSAEWDHLPSDYKYWIYPAACLVAWYLGKSEFMAHLMAGTLLRYAINLAFTALSKLDCVAEPRRIHKENPPANQLERELDWDGPIILSPVAFLLVDALTPWFSTIAPFSAKGVGVMFAAHYGIVEVRLRPPAPQFLPLVLTAHLTTCAAALLRLPPLPAQPASVQGVAPAPPHLDHHRGDLGHVAPAARERGLPRQLLVPLPRAGVVRLLLLPPRLPLLHLLRRAQLHRPLQLRARPALGAEGAA